MEEMGKYLLYAFLIYLAGINLIAFVYFGLDKRKARKDQWRIPEKKLICLSALGGSIGAMIGMKVFHHKTKKKKFSIGIPLIFVCQVLAVGAVLYLRWK